jgi:hypothetical protein
MFESLPTRDYGEYNRKTYRLQTRFELMVTDVRRPKAQTLLDRAFLQSALLFVLLKA